MINKWTEHAPPINTWVWAKYDKEWFLVKTCKQGCCVFSDIGTLIPPIYWYEATKEQSESAQLGKQLEIDWFSLYIE